MAPDLAEILANLFSPPAAIGVVLHGIPLQVSGPAVPSPSCPAPLSPHPRRLFDVADATPALDAKTPSASADRATAISLRTMPPPPLAPPPI